MKDTLNAYEEMIDAQLKEWSAQIALFKAKADNAKADAKIDSCAGPPSGLGRGCAGHSDHKPIRREVFCVK